MLNMLEVYIIKVSNIIFGIESETMPAKIGKIAKGWYSSWACLFPTGSLSTSSKDLRKCHHHLHRRIIPRLLGSGREVNTSQPFGKQTCCFFFTLRWKKPGTKKLPTCELIAADGILYLANVRNCLGAVGVKSLLDALEHNYTLLTLDRGIGDSKRWKMWKFAWKSCWHMWFWHYNLCNFKRYGEFSVIQHVGTPNESSEIPDTYIYIYIHTYIHTHYIPENTDDKLINCTG